MSSRTSTVDHVGNPATPSTKSLHAIALGWSANQVIVIDEDQGRSGRTADKRTGFQRLWPRSRSIMWAWSSV